MNDKTPAPFLSCIVPVYNTADYLEECLDSILRVPIPLEIIIVNDGSTDNSGEIIRQYCTRYSCVKVIVQPNRGLSIARNIGFEAATGKYVLFVDSDDIVMIHGIMNMVDMAKTFSPDIVLGSVESFWKDGKTKIWGTPVLPSTIYFVKGEEMLGLMMSNGYVPMVFAYMCRRDYIVNNGARFMPAIIHEDELWTPMVLLAAESICVSGLIHYRYRQRKESIMYATSCEHRFLSIATIVHILLDKIRSYTKLSDSVSLPTHSFLWWRVSVLMQVLISLDFPAGAFLIGQLCGRIGGVQSELFSASNKMIGSFLYCYLNRIKHLDISQC